MNKLFDNNTKLVFSTDANASLNAQNDVNEVYGDGIVKIRRETKGRKGSGVVTISDIPEDLERIKQIAKQLKKKCGTGGSVKDRVIEIQGDNRELIKHELVALGYTVKFTGG